MTLSKALLLIAILLIAGCSLKADPVVYWKPTGYPTADVNAEIMAADRYCRFPGITQPAMDRCMQSRGWHTMPPEHQALWRGLARQVRHNGMPLRDMVRRFNRETDFIYMNDNPRATWTSIERDIQRAF